MCWETSTLFACGCSELTDVRFCEHSIFPWTHNVAHPRGLPMNPTVRIERSAEYCRDCIKERVVGVVALGVGASGSGSGWGPGEYEGKGKGRGKGEESDEFKEYSKDPLGDKMKEMRRRAKILRGELDAQGGAGIGGTGAPRVFGQPSAAGAPIRETLEDVRENEEDEDEDDDDENEYDDEEDTEAHLEVEPPMLDEMVE
ncbi:hypothetical protein VTL71DRAFT_3763 [Oculimacula yallundae]|uniref:Uncharacterized protein n=1 Tax=Oculimacula yallundae TaxID=86028 RepID=A0ABR4C555_9HELO